MEIVGFICIAVILIVIGLGLFICSWDGLGEYNIGGVPNSWVKRAAIIAVIVGYFKLWVMLLANSPLTVVIN